MGDTKGVRTCKSPLGPWAVVYMGCIALLRESVVDFV